MPRVASLWFPMLPIDRLRGRQSRSSHAPERGGVPLAAPCVTAAVEHGRHVVVACSAEALVVGVRPAMLLAEARMLTCDLAVAETDEVADAALLVRIATHAARRWTPLAAVDPPDGLLLDIGATAHLFGGEAALAHIMLSAARRAGLVARLAVADSVGAAHALARYGASKLTIVSPGEDAAAIGLLPPAALRLDADVVAVIGRLGFATIADLLAVPRAPLIRRFGRTFGLRIEQALAVRHEPIDALVLPTVPVACRLLLDPIFTSEAIGKVIKDLAADICGVLEDQRLGARRVLLVCRRVDGRDETVAIGLAQPSRDPAHLGELLCRRIERIDPGFGIEAMALRASLVDPLAPVQIVRAALSGVRRRRGEAADERAPIPSPVGALRTVVRGANIQPVRREWEGASSPSDAVASDPSVHPVRAEPLDVDAPHIPFADRGPVFLPTVPNSCSDGPESMPRHLVGSDREQPSSATIIVFSQAIQTGRGRSRIPIEPEVEEKVDLPTLIDRLANRFGIAALHRAGLHESDTPERMVARLAPLAPPTGRSWQLDWPRPSRLLRRPEPIANAIADMPDYAPAVFTWRGTRYRVVAADGPERVCGEWWRGGTAPHRVRDYFQVEVADGGRYWLFRAGDDVHSAPGPSNWFMHGAFA